MYFIYSFLFCGTICLIAELILDNTKLTPGHITSIFVVVGAALDAFGIYDFFIATCGGGTLSTNHLLWTLSYSWSLSKSRNLSILRIINGNV